MQARPCAGAPLTGLHHTRRFATPDCVRSNLVVARAAADVNKDAGPSVRKRPPRGPSTQPCGPVDFSVPVDDDNKPRNILEEIVWHKNTEVERMRSRKPLPMLKQLASRVVPARDFKATLLKRLEETGKPGLIAEVKKASPSRGVIQPDFDPVRIAKAYEQGGAGCLSVLTDSKYFQGSFEYLQAIRRSGVQCPLLCKDFIVEGYQIFNARVHGADAVLLIAAVLTNSDMQYFLAIAESLGMQCLIEVHTEAELQRCLELPKLEKHLLGINNRDLSTFKVELENTKRIMDAPVGQQVKAQDLIMVGESGIFTPEDVAFVQSAGCRAILVGESIVKQGDAASAVRQLLQLQD